MRAGRYVVLIVEDDPKLRETLSHFLEENRYTVLTAEDGKKALEIYFSHNHEIDMILLDVMLPEVDGYEILKTIREYSSVPIIMTTSKESEEEQLEGLNNGADHYLTKPFRLRILLAHIENLLNRYLGSARVETCGALRVEIQAQEVQLDGKIIPLTPKEFSLLMFFIQNKNKVLSRETILDSVWGYDYEGDIRTVDTLVKQLRRKLTDRYPYIHSVYGMGYCFKES